MSAMVGVRRPKRRRGSVAYPRQVPRMRLPGGLRGVARIGGYYGRFAGPSAELKFFDTVKVFTAASTGGVVMDDSINHIPQGNKENERIGRKCTLKSIAFKGAYKNAVTTVATETDNRIRIVVFWDRQANGNAATAAEIFGAAPTINTFQNLANSSRFQVMFDSVHNIINPAVVQTAAGNFTTYQNEYSWRWYKRCTIPIEFDATATDGSIATIRSNNVGILAFSAQGVGIPSLSYTCRVRYSDAG